MSLSMLRNQIPHQSNEDQDIVEIPLTTETQLLELGETIPGQPHHQLADHDAVRKFLVAELSTQKLADIYGMLFLTSKRDNISPLHHQKIKYREVCITERPDLHLLWYYERIYIKPIPKCLLSYDFWRLHMKQQENGRDLLKEANGFLRTYSYLVVHESDFDIAIKLRLMPRDVTWEQWCHFIKPFRTLSYREVAPRYHYGEIRLTRLNFWTTVLYRSSYAQVHHNYAIYFSRFGAPYIFVFGAITVLLTALQTGLATDANGGTYHDVAVSFVPFTLVLTLIGLVLLPLLFSFFQLKELLLFFRKNQKLQ